MPTYVAETYSSGTRGRALSKIRTNHFVVDDPASLPYEGPGEAPNAGEIFLSGITACAVLMIERLARADANGLEPARELLGIVALLQQVGAHVHRAHHR